MVLRLDQSMRVGNSVYAERIVDTQKGIRCHKVHIGGTGGRGSRNQSVVSTKFSTQWYETN